MWKLGDTINSAEPCQAENFSEQLRRLAAELRKVREQLESVDVDAAVLRDFREVLENTRSTAWIVHEWVERQRQVRDVYPWLALLSAERIRRATRLSLDLATDLDAPEETIESEGLGDLYPTVKSLYTQLAKLVEKT